MRHTLKSERTQIESGKDQMMIIERKIDLALDTLEMLILELEREESLECARD
jgi:hypothetical protein